jgi:PAS domain S-box-containing protein
MSTPIDLLDPKDCEREFAVKDAEPVAPCAPEVASSGVSLAGLGPLLELAWVYSRDAMIVVDCDSGILVEVNPATESLTRRLRIELIGQSLTVLYPTEEAPAVRDAFRQASEAQASNIPGFHILRRKGRKVPVTIFASEPFELGGRKLLVAQFHDLTKWIQQEERLEVNRWALESYAAAALAMVHATTASGLMQAICEAITRESPFIFAGVAFAEQGEDFPVRWGARSGSICEMLEDAKLCWNPDEPSGQGPTGVALRIRQPVIVNDCDSDPRFVHLRYRARPVGIRSSMSIPFSVGESLPGVLIVFSSRRRAFGKVIADAFTHLAAEIGVGIARLEQTERLEVERKAHEISQKDLAETLSAVVSSMSTAMEKRDPYTAGHQSRVAALCMAIAQELHLEESHIKAIGVAAMVHDIGKISIPAEILSKAVRLRHAEWLLVQEQPETGYAILKDVPFRWPIAEAVRQHHERLDGTGYPRGLKGDQILFGARIIAVADTVESMASSRPYRDSMGLERALAEIEQQSGAKLDPEVVRICLMLFRERGFQFPDLPTVLD